MTKQTMKWVYLCCSIIQFLIIYLIVDVMVVKRTYTVQATLRTESLAELASLYGAEKALIQEIPESQDIVERVLMKEGIIPKKAFLVVLCFRRSPCLRMVLPSRNFRGQFLMTRKESWEFKNIKVTRLKE